MRVRYPVCGAGRFCSSSAVVSPVLGVLAAVACLGLFARAQTVRSPASRVTRIDQQAPGLFDGTTPGLRSLQVRYRLDAVVLLPLGFASIPLWSRPDVGWVAASYRDRPGEAAVVLRGYELFSASRPERAQGLNRLGFFREALRMTPAGVAETDYFGAMSTSPERSYREAMKSVESRQPQVYEVTDGFTAALEARASVFEVAADAPAANAAALYDIIHERLDQPRRSPSAAGSSACPLPSLAFIGALEISLQAVAAADGRLDATRGRVVGFVHNGTVRQLELRSCTRDQGRGRRMTGSGFVRDANGVYCLDYRITAAGREDGAFRIWVDLAGARTEAPGVPMAPLAWDFQPRAFLRLIAERVR